jgi:serine-type D-Ala-D-Ala carboxypeptidase/endopeptidase
MTQETWQLPSDSAIGGILAQRIDTERSGVAIVVGVIDRRGRRIVAYGARKAGDSAPLDGDTVFEVGSISKVLTCLLLADMAEHGEVALNDPAGKYLPDGVSMPTRRRRQITLTDLATHTSGLPRMPPNLAPASAANPFADYGAKQLYALLNGLRLARDIGKTYDYSNLGSGLLGHLLALRGGQEYEALVDARILGPLGMTSTAMTLGPHLQGRLAHGHDRALEPVANWDWDVLAGAGAFRSTVNDLLRFLAAELGYADTPLKAAMAAQLVPRRPTGAKAAEIALGWHISTRDERPIVWHNGSAGGYRAFLGMNLAAGTGAVVLTNASTDRGGDDIGFHLLTGAPLKPPPPVRTAIAVGEDVLERCVGRYGLAPQRVLTVRREGARLLAQITAQRESEIHAETEATFFWKTVDAKVTFEPDADGRTARAVIRQGGRYTVCERIAD